MLAHMGEAATTSGEQSYKKSVSSHTHTHKPRSYFPYFLLFITILCGQKQLQT